MLMFASAFGYRTYGTKELEFENIELKAGDEVIINTDDMTVTINGQNATVFLSADSDFFKLKPAKTSFRFLVQTALLAMPTSFGRTGGCKMANPNIQYITSIWSALRFWIKHITLDMN